jgi:hypothetical protein
MTYNKEDAMAKYRGWKAMADNYRMKAKLCREFNQLSDAIEHESSAAKFDRAAEGELKHAESFDSLHYVI